MGSFVLLLSFFRKSEGERMNKTILFSSLALGLSCSSIYASSDASFPSSQWKFWPVYKRGEIPAVELLQADAAQKQKANSESATGNAVSEAHAQFSKTYAWMNQGAGTTYTIKFNPDVLDKNNQLKASAEGTIAIIEFQGVNEIFTTEYYDGEPMYGVFDAARKTDQSDARESYSVDYCAACHDYYLDTCKNGICSLPK